MTLESVPAPKPALIPTTVPLPPQTLRPEEVEALVTEAAARHAEAEEALAAAQDLFDQAERAREYALSEEQKRQEREEQFRIEKMRTLFAAVEDDAQRMRRLFKQACAAEDIDFADVLGYFTYWSRYRATSARLRDAIIRYDSSRDADSFRQWLFRIEAWNNLIRSVTSWRKGGVLGGEADDLQGLAEVNARINQESQSAPRALNRDAHDQSTPFVEDLGIRDPSRASWDLLSGPQRALEFSVEFSAAIAESADDWARRATDHVTETARAEFKAAAIARTDAE
jgi:hypothetical protein